MTKKLNQKLVNHIDETNYIPQYENPWSIQAVLQKVYSTLFIKVLK